MRKLVTAVTTLALVAGGTMTAKAVDVVDLTAYGISSKVATAPTLTLGNGQFFPIVNRLTATGAADFANMVLVNGEGDQLTLTNEDGSYIVEGKATYKDKFQAIWSDSSKAIDVPFVLQGPMNIGHINFDSGSSALDSNDKLLLIAMAKEVVKTGLKGIYLVGKADPVGSYEGNMAISLKRVTAAQTFLENYLEKLGVTDATIITEYMGDLTATAPAGKANLEDRRVEVTIFPII